MSFYGQKAAGYWKATQGTVMLLNRKSRINDPEQATNIYTNYVTDEANAVLSTGYQGWIAAEAHRGDPKPREQWVWRFANTNHMLEAIWVEDLLPSEVAHLADTNKGRGWRFPHIYIFLTQPHEGYLDVLRQKKVPWGIESELWAIVEEPPPPADWKKAVKNRLDMMGSIARDILDIIEKV